MSTLQSILRYINEDYAPPTIRLILVSQNGVLINKIVPKKTTLKDILIQEGLKEEKNYILFGKPVNLEQNIIDLIPKNYSNLSNIELIIEDKNILLDQEKIYYEKILKPFDNPFKVLVFTPSEFNVSIKAYSSETIEKYKLNKFDLKLSSYCNTPQNLYLSGGSGDDYSSFLSGNNNFWKINSIKTNIEKLNDLPIDKRNHSMIYIPRRYIYFIGGNNRSTFFYDIFFSTFNSWASMNKQVKNPCLILVNNIFIYSFGEQDINNSDNNLIFERTNLKSINPKWELKILKNQYFPLRNFGGFGIDDEIYFLGGRINRGEKMYKFNTTTENIEKFKQENTKLIPLDKNFYDINEFNSAMIPEFQNNKNIQIIIFNKKKKKYRKVLYEKNFEETINNGKLKYTNLDNSLIKENEQMKIVWKEYKNAYTDINILPENIIVLPSIEELKEGKLKLEYNINNNEEIKENLNENNIYTNFSNNGKKISIINNNEINIDTNNLNLNAKNENENNIRLKDKLNFDINAEAENNNSLLDKKSNSLLNKDTNKNLNLKTEFINIKSEQPETVNNIDISNKNENNEFEKEKKNLNDSPNLYRKKNVIKQDKKNTILIQGESNENLNKKANLNDKNNINNINNNNENLKNSNAFNIEYNNEILVEDNKMATLSDIISSNSELNKNNQGLNSRIVINVPKTKIIEKNKIELDKNQIMTKEAKDDKEQENRNNINIESIEFPIQQNPDIKIDLKLENENKMNNNSSLRDNDNKNEIEIIEIEQKSENKNEGNINNKKLEGESIEGELTGKDEESKNIDKNSNIKDNNVIEIQIDIKENDKNSLQDEDTEKLLRDKIIYNETEKKELNKIEDSSKPKEFKEEVITGIIRGIPKSKENKNEVKSSVEEEIVVREQHEENNNIPITLNSILKGNIEDDIKLNKNLPNKNISQNLNDKNIGSNQINPIENNEIQNNSLKEQTQKIILKFNNESDFNDINSKLDLLKEKEKEKYAKAIEINEKKEIPKNENIIDIKNDKIKEEYNNINGNIIKEEIIKGEIPGIKQKIKSESVTVLNDKNNKISLKENELESLKNNSNINQENIELNKEKDNKIYESITGSIIGTSKMKNIIEYGNTKGYQKPNIKKGIDFTHNPEIIIEGTIKGTKKIPPTLKTIFQDNINQPVLLNNINSLKPSEYIISKADIPSYLKKQNDLNISEESLKIQQIKIEKSEIKIENTNNIEVKENNNEILSPRLSNKNNIIKTEIDTKIQLNDDNIKNPKISYEESSKHIINENPTENLEIHLPKNDFDFDMNVVKNSNEKPRIEEINEITSEQKNQININNEPIIKNISPNLEIKNINLNQQSIDKKIPSNNAYIDININEKESPIIQDTSNKANEKEEIIEEIKPNEEKEKNEEFNINIPEMDFKKIEKIKNAKNLEKSEKENLNKNKENMIYETITGSIIGTPRMKNIVEYGSTKGYKRPNIKKGKDFIHNPKIIIEGTIKGIKKTPLTLKSLFEDKINNKVELNKINKHPEIKLEDYQESLLLNIDINNPKNDPQNSLKNDINLKSDNKISLNKPVLNEIKDEIIIEKEKTVINKNFKGEEIKGIIPGIKKNLSVKPEENKIRGQISRPHMGGSINNNISNINKEKIKEDMPNYHRSVNININRPINLEKDKESNESKTQIKLGKEKGNMIYETITGSIIGTPRMKNIVEYGSTKGYKRPNIKKGKDFIHNPKIIIEGTIKGIKKTPLTLKSLFEDKVNNKVELNNTYSKIKDEYKIKNEDIELYSLNLSKPEENVNSIELKLGNPQLIEYNLKSKEDLLKDKIKSIDINLKNNEIKSNISLKDTEKKIEDNSNEEEEKINKNTQVRNIDNNNMENNEIKDKINENKTELIEGIIIGTSENKVVEKENESLNDNKNKEDIINNNNNNININSEKEILENITGIIEGTSTMKNIVEYGSTKGYKRPNIKKGKDFVHNPEIVISGIIGGKKNIDSNKEEKYNIVEQKPKVQLRRAEKLNFIEYGSTLNFVRPNIKKGIDFYHEPKVKISKKNYDDEPHLDNEKNNI